MSSYVFDIEANGLEPDRVWCAVFLDTETGEFTEFYSEEGFTVANSKGLREFVNKADCLIGHNILGYDIPVLQDVIDIDHMTGRLVDTLVWSTVSRKWRHAHSVESYGEEYGIPKPKHEEWDKFSEEMLHRCREDVKIQHKIWRGLCQETEEWQGYCLKERAKRK